ncbi:MAG: SBBP repeat-containing protein [Bacteroidetes bacterium]|nr:SBBP repeat-containing protein [Bacteroidota bacterium]
MKDITAGNGDDLASALVVFSLPTLPTTTLALDDSGNVYVTGHSLGIGSEDDYATIKYSQKPASVGIETIPAEISLLQLFLTPQPTNSQSLLGSKTVKWSNYR